MRENALKSHERHIREMLSNLNRRFLKRYKNIEAWFASEEFKRLVTESLLNSGSFKEFDKNMPKPKWLEKQRQETAKDAPFILDEGMHVLEIDIEHEPEKGPYKKTIFGAHICPSPTYVKARYVNLSLPPTATLKVLDLLGQEINKVVIEVQGSSNNKAYLVKPYKAS